MPNSLDGLWETFMRTKMLGALLAVGFTTSVMAASSGQVPVSIAKAVADPRRSAGQVATDADRKPAETLAFSGVKPGMIVGEFYPGGGYFTQMLSDVVGARGHIYGLENAGWDGAVRDDQKFVADKKLVNVSIEGRPIGTVAFPVPLDLAWISQNYHDLKVAEFGHVDTEAFDKAVFAALKPGGYFFILDHQAPPGTADRDIAKIHRIDKAEVIREVTAAGFRLVAEGKFLDRPSDDHTLPIFDKRIKGRTDRFALRFQKPAA